MESEGKYTETKESQMFSGISENFRQLEAVMSSNNNVVSQGFSSITERLWLILKMNLLKGFGAALAITWKAGHQGKRLGSSQDCCLESQRSADPVRALFLQLIPWIQLTSGPLSATGTTPLFIPAISVTICNCYCFQRGPSRSVLFASLATDLVQAGVSA